MTKLQYGILGTAQIARKNWRAIRNSGNSTLAAVASRSLDRARQFIHECQTDEPFDTPPRALGSYEELLASPEIEGVYIPLPTGLRKEWVIRAARAGKHILCEKPCAVSSDDLREMLHACRENNVQFLDGVMFMHSRRLTRMREVLNDPGSIGDTRRIQSAFTFSAPPEFYEGNIRTQLALEPHGCMGDVGWYCIRLSLWAMNWQMPRQHPLRKHRSHRTLRRTLFREWRLRRLLLLVRRQQPAVGGHQRHARLSAHRRFRPSRRRP
ncbi:MAG TPA: Gfo/Idh/MocA family oxidoreductase [Bryobacteraceae bacterium]|nr:Gfo/Idh/MocA family oxidoreductase [Bryobacteraceae bacterium]